MQTHTIYKLFTDLKLVQREDTLILRSTKNFKLSSCSESVETWVYWKKNWSRSDVVALNLKMSCLYIVYPKINITVDLMESKF